MCSLHSVVLHLLVEPRTKKFFNCEVHDDDDSMAMKRVTESAIHVGLNHHIMSEM